MTVWLKQSTATTAMIGPFIESTSGTSAQNGLTITSAGIMLSKNGAAFSGKASTGSCTSAGYGFYSCPLSSGDVDTLGRLTLTTSGVANTSALPVWHEYMVVTANVWDSLYSTDKLQVTMTSAAADVITAAAIATSAITSAEAPLLANLDAAVTSRLSSAGYTAPPAVSAIRTEIDSNSTKLDVAVSTRLATTGYSAPPTTGAIAAAVWEETLTSHVLADSASTWIKDIDAEVDALAGTVVEGTPQNISATTGVATKGTVTTGTYASTILDNGIYWQIQNVASSLDVYATFLCGNKRASQVTVNGHYAGGVGSRVCDVYAYNYTTSAYEQLSDSVTRMNNSANDVVYTYNLLSSHQKNLTSGGGEVTIRFATASTNTADYLYLDQILVKATAAGSTPSEIADAVYAKMKYTFYEGGIWIDTVAGTSGTDLGVHGTPTNPVNNYADALTLASALGVKRFYLRPNTTITLTQDHSGWRFIGYGRINLNGQGIADAVFEDIYSVRGVSSGDDARFTRCGIGSSTSAITLDHSYLEGCLIKTTVSMATDSSEKELFLHACSDAAASGTAKFVFAGDRELYLRSWNGGVELDAMSSSSQAFIDGAGRVIVSSGCSGGTLTIRGSFTVVDNSSGAVTISDGARWAEDQSVASVTSMSLTEKVLTNKMVESEDGTTITIYEDNGTDILGTFSWSEGTKTRGKFTEQ